MGEASSPKPLTQRFPPEIRNMIYRYALEDTYPDHGLKLYKPYNRILEEHEQRALETGDHGIELGKAEYKAANIWFTPPLLLLCKQVTEEVLPILKLQTFHFDCRTPGPFQNALPVTEFVRPETVKYLKNVSIKMPFFEEDQEPINATMNTILSLLRESTRLEELQIHFIWVFNQSQDNFRDGDVREWVYKMLSHRKTETQMHHDAILLCEADKQRSYKTKFEYDLAAENDAVESEVNASEDENLVILAKDTFKKWGFKP